MDVNSLLEQLAPLVKEYEDKKKKRMDAGFNVFYLISDYYYRETFHGDILYALLSPEAKHEEGNLFVHLFIDMLNKSKKLVDKENYNLVDVRREYGTNDGNDIGRIDLLIFGEGNHCIVIENKLNDAGDTYHQLPKYRKDLEEIKHYDIDAFVYIPKNPYKRPDTSDWSDDEKEAIENKLVVIPAYEDGQNNLIDNWLSIAEDKTQNDDARFVIKHYKTLLKNLTIDIMDTDLEKFYNILLHEDNLKTAQSIRDMLDQDKGIPGYMANRIKDRYKQKCSPFKDVHIHKDRDAVFDQADINGIVLKFDIWCYDTGYKVVFWADEKVVEEDFVELALKINALKDFVKQEGINWYVKHFEFTDERGLFAFLDQVLDELCRISKKS